MFKCITDGCSLIEEKPERQHCLCEMPISCHEIKETIWVEVKTYICSDVCENCSIILKDVINFGGEDNFTLCHTLRCPINKEELN